jgi:hypothetical protein
MGGHRESGGTGTAKLTRLQRRRQTTRSPQQHTFRLEFHPLICLDAAPLPLNLRCYSMLSRLSPAALYQPAAPHPRLRYGWRMAA